MKLISILCKVCDTMHDDSMIACMKKYIPLFRLVTDVFSACINGKLM